MTGRRAGFDQAVECCFGDLYRYPFWLCRDRWQAGDVVQEALLRASRAWPALRRALGAVEYGKGQRRA